MLCTYTGTDGRHYLDYRDAATGRTLEVSPGGSYDIEVISGQAPGLAVPPGDGRWAVAASAARDDHGRWLAAPAQDGEIETPAPAEAAVPAAEEPASPVPAAEPEPAAPDTPEEAGDSPAEVES